MNFVGIPQGQRPFLKMLRTDRFRLWVETRIGRFASPILRHPITP